MAIPDGDEEIIRIPSFRKTKEEISSDSSDENPSSEDEEDEEEHVEKAEKESSDSSEIIVPSKLIEVSKFHRGITKK